MNFCSVFKYPTVTFSHQLSELFTLSLQNRNRGTIFVFYWALRFESKRLYYLLLISKAGHTISANLVSCCNCLLLVLITSRATGSVLVNLLVLPYVFHSFMLFYCKFCDFQVYCHNKKRDCWHQALISQCK